MEVVLTHEQLRSLRTECKASEGLHHQDGMVVIDETSVCLIGMMGETNSYPRILPKPCLCNNKECNAWIPEFRQNPQEVYQKNPFSVGGQWRRPNRTVHSNLGG